MRKLLLVRALKRSHRGRQAPGFLHGPRLKPRSERLRSNVMDENSTRNAVDEFILNEIDTVPHLEALLLLWNSRPQEWSFEAMASAIYLSLDATQAVIEDLERRGFIVLTDNRGFLYRSTDRDQLVE